MRPSVVAFLAVALLSALDAHAETPWERYLQTLSPHTASAVAHRSYSAPRSAEDQLQDLRLLAWQVTAGDVSAYRLAIRIADATEPGESLEELAEMAGRFVRINPGEFLLAQRESKECFGVDFLGGPFVDRPEAARIHELAARAEALELAQAPEIAHIKRACIKRLRGEA
jgi:hypothetical protein